MVNPSIKKFVIVPQITFLKTTKFDILHLSPCLELLLWPLHFGFAIKKFLLLGLALPTAVQLKQNISKAGFTTKVTVSLKVNRRVLHIQARKWATSNSCFECWSLKIKSPLILTKPTFVAYIFLVISDISDPQQWHQLQREQDIITLHFPLTSTHISPHTAVPATEGVIYRTKAFVYSKFQ